MLTKNPDFMISRGSTPWIRMELPLEIARSDVIYATLSQSDVNVLEYQRNGTAVSIAGSGALTIDDANPKRLILAMTQADTLALAEGQCKLQIRIRTSVGADTFYPLNGYVVAAEKGGEI